MPDGTETNLTWDLIFRTNTPQGDDPEPSVVVERSAKLNHEQALIYSYRGGPAFTWC